MAPLPPTSFDTASLDAASVDAALMTTRAVRRRLDLERPVDRQIILDCIDIAEQAPSGGNQGSRRWIVIEDQRIKDRLAEIYMESAGEWMIETHERLAGTGHPQEKVMASAAHLAKHLAEVPAIVIPTIIGVHDGSGRPGLFDSVIQSVWSFCVALRARGLGTAWTTAILSRQEDLAELLGIPDGMTQIVMLPVGWMKGNTVHLAPRLPARQITYFDGFARTWETGPSNPPRFTDGPGVVVEADIKAKADTIWPLVTAVGDSENSGVVDRNEPNRSFGWVTDDADNPGTRWRFELHPIAGATRLRYQVILGPGPSGTSRAIEQMPEKEGRIIDRRLTEHRANMQLVVDGIKVEAERKRPDRPETAAKAPLS